MIITHNDLDGIVSAYFVMKGTGQLPTDVRAFSYSVERDGIWQSMLAKQPRGEVIFTDLSFKRNELDWARGIEKERRWLWFDHHKSSLDFDHKGVFDQVFIDASGEVCAADLTSEWLLDQEVAWGELANAERFEIINEWRAVAHDRDLWINNDRNRNMKLDMVVRACIKERRIPHLLEAMDLGIDHVLKIYNEFWKQGMVDYKKSLELAKGTFYLNDFSDFNVVVFFVGSSASDVADSMYKTDKDIIAMVAIYPPNAVVNLRTKRDDVDLSIIARRLFDGGGHAKAAGGKLNRHFAGDFREISDMIVWGMEEQWEAEDDG